MLSPVALAQQQAGGTWSQLFSYGWLQNRYPVLGLILWYVFILLLGLLMYPIVRYALPGLGDKGYPAARALGLVLLGLFLLAGWLRRLARHAAHDPGRLPTAGRRRPDPGLEAAHGTVARMELAPAVLPDDRRAVSAHSSSLIC